MIDVSLQFISQLIEILPGLIGIYILFDFIGTLLFGRS